MFHAGPAVTIPPMVSVFTRGIGWVDEIVAGSAPASGAWPTADLAVYHPIILAAPCVIRRVWWANGAAAAGNIDVGVYRDDGDAKPGAKVISSGATAQSGTNAVQFADVTDTAIAAGRYWLAITASSTSSTIFRSTLAASTAIDAPLRMQEASANPLPSSATPVESAADNVYLFGFSTVASP